MWKNKGLAKMIKPKFQSETGKTKLRPGTDLPHTSEAPFWSERHIPLPQTTNSRSVGGGPCFPPDNIFLSTISPQKKKKARQYQTAWITHALLVGLHNDSAILENGKRRLLKKKKRQFLYKPTIILFGISKGEMETYFHTKI